MSETSLTPGARNGIVVRGEHVVQSHQIDELPQLGRRVPQPYLTALAAGCELEPRERVDRDRVDVDAADVAARELGLVLAQQRADGRTARGGRPGRAGPRSRGSPLPGGLVLSQKLIGPADR